MMRNIQKIVTVFVAAAPLTLLAARADATGMFGPESLNGNFVLSADGGFVAMTPFAPEPLRLSVVIVGRIAFNGAGEAHGKWTVSFHNAKVPFGVRSRFEVVGSYEVEADGHMFVEFEEFKIEPPMDDDGIADAIVGLECYVVVRQQEARCVLNRLISFQQGPLPVPEPVTLSAVLLRQK